MVFKLNDYAPAFLAIGHNIWLMLFLKILIEYHIHRYPWLHCISPPPQLRLLYILPASDMGFLVQYFKQLLHIIFGGLLLLVERS